MRQAEPSLLPVAGERQAELQVLSPGPAVCGPPVGVARRRLYDASKRAVDAVGALTLLIITLPLLAAIALLIRLDSPGPVLFRQVRVGQYGRTFTFYKFRTMYDGADQEVHRRYIESLMRNQELGGDAPGTKSNQRLYKMANDPRVTRVGHVLRRTSLDELPQLLNVLKGEMSLVGPRPGLPYEVNAYSEWQSARLVVLPGITGWWQVQGRCRRTFDEMIHLDLEYISRRSFWLDLKILALTVPAVASCRGAA